MDPKSFTLISHFSTTVSFHAHFSKGDNIREFSRFKNEAGRRIKFYFKVIFPSYSNWQLYNLTQLGTRPLHWSQVAKNPKQNKPISYLVSCKYGPPSFDTVVIS